MDEEDACFIEEERMEILIGIVLTIIAYNKGVQVEWMLLYWAILMSGDYIDD